VGLVPSIEGSRSFPDGIAKQELGNELRLELGNELKLIPTRFN